MYLCPKIHYLSTYQSKLSAAIYAPRHINNDDATQSPPQKATAHPLAARELLCRTLCMFLFRIDSTLPFGYDAKSPLYLCHSDEPGLHMGHLSDGAHSNLSPQDATRPASAFATAPPPFTHLVYLECSVHSHSTQFAQRFLLLRFCCLCLVAKWACVPIMQLLYIVIL